MLEEIEREFEGMSTYKYLSHQLIFFRGNLEPVFIFYLQLLLEVLNRSKLMIPEILKKNVNSLIHFFSSSCLEQLQPPDCPSPRTSGIAEPLCFFAAVRTRIVLEKYFETVSEAKKLKTFGCFLHSSLSAFALIPLCASAEQEGWNQKLSIYTFFT